MPEPRLPSRTLGRHYTDIDFAAYGREADRIPSCWPAPDTWRIRTSTSIEGTRLVAEHPGIGMHLDVFLDKLEFCHTVRWNGRLEHEEDTIPLAELLIQKMQIVEINEKDLIDTIMLLLEYPSATRTTRRSTSTASRRLCEGLGLVADAHDEPRQGAADRRAYRSSPTRRRDGWPNRSWPPRQDRGRAQVILVEAPSEGRRPEEVVPGRG